MQTRIKLIIILFILSLILAITETSFARTTVLTDPNKSIRTQFIFFNWPQLNFERQLTLSLKESQMTAAQYNKLCKPIALQYIKQFEKIREINGTKDYFINACKFNTTTLEMQNQNIPVSYIMQNMLDEMALPLYQISFGFKFSQYDQFISQAQSGFWSMFGLNLGHFITVLFIFTALSIATNIYLIWK